MLTYWAKSNCSSQLPGLFKLGKLGYFRERKIITCTLGNSEGLLVLSRDGEKAHMRPAIRTAVATSLSSLNQSTSLNQSIIALNQPVVVKHERD